MSKAQKHKRKPIHSLKRQEAKDKKKAAKTGSKYDALDSDEEPEPVAVVQGPVAVAFANPGPRSGNPP